MKPKVSIIVPIYNIEEKKLQKCIDCLINQSMDELEIILVDDGSIMQCGELCDKYASQDNRIKVIHKQNEGLAAARNTGFDAATGENIMIIDGDDWIDIDCCERALNTLIKENVQMVFFNIVYEYGKSSIKKKVFGNVGKKFQGNDCKHLQEHSLSHNSYIDQAYAKLINVDFLRKNNIKHIEELSHGAESFIFTISLFNHLKSAYYMPDAMYHYRYSQQGITQRPDYKKYKLIVECLKYVEMYIKHCDNYDNLENKLLLRTLYIVVMVAMTGYFSPANKDTYRNKIIGFKEFVNNPFIKRSFKSYVWKKMDIRRIIIIHIIRLRYYFLLNLLGILRYWQLNKR